MPWYLLLLVQSATRPCIPRARLALSADAAKVRTLVVEDDTVLRRAVANYLSDQGFVVREAANAHEALRAIDDEIPDAMVLDVMMPGVGGLELLQHLRRTDGVDNIPVVLLTARGLKDDRINGYAAGCNAYLTKPFDPEELVAIIHNVVEAHRRYSRVPAPQPSGVLASVYVPGGAQASARADWQASLTQRERQVLDLVTRGLMNKEIAKALEISPRMVEKYVSRLLAKAGAATRTELARLVVEQRDVAQ